MLCDKLLIGGENGCLPLCLFTYDNLPWKMDSPLTGYCGGNGGGGENYFPRDFKTKVNIYLLLLFMA